MTTTTSPSPARATTIGTWANAIIRALDSYGVDGVALCREAGIDVQRTTDPNYRIPVSVMTPLWRRAVELSGDGAFGLRVAEHVSPTTFHALGFASLASRNFQDVARLIVNNVAVVSEVAKVRLQMKPDQIWFYVDILEDGPEVSDEAVDAFLGSLIYIGRHFVGAELPLTEVRLRRPDTGIAQQFEAFFRTPVHFSCEANALVGPLSAASQLMPGYNPMLVEANEKLLNEYRATQSRSLVARVEQQIETLLPEEPVQQLVAQQLHMSVRKLQRALEKEETSYQQILDQYRERKARALLKENRVSVKEIAWQLGFANQSAFTRAFKRWTGKTPRQTQGSAE